MRVAVLGSRGQLGSAVAYEFRSCADVVALDRAALDIRDDEAVERQFNDLRPDVIVNCAGYNAVDAAEDHPVDAFRGNAFAVRTLARSARAHDAVFVQYSSDFVFDGTADTPYVETDTMNPRSVYAMSKMLGEWFAEDAPKHYVLRVESLFGVVPGGPPARGSAAAVVAGLRAGTSPNVFVDRTVSPTYIWDAARATRELLQRRVPYGTFHCVNAGLGTWLDFAQEAALILGIEPRVTPVRVEDVPLKAPRPKYCALSEAKLRSYGVEMPTWQDALRRHLAGASDSRE
jgi:dTDP-4-dehydrorhamnose reductase